MCHMLWSFLSKGEWWKSLTPQLCQHFIFFFFCICNVLHIYISKFICKKCKCLIVVIASANGCKLKAGSIMHKMMPKAATLEPVLELLVWKWKKSCRRKFLYLPMTRLVCTNVKFMQQFQALPKQHWIKSYINNVWILVEDYFGLHENT